MNDIKLTDEQIRVMNLSTNQPVFIRGVAGSGKTTTAILRLNRIIAQSDMYNKPRVGVFSFAKTLITYIGTEIDSKDAVCKNFHGWAYQFLSQCESIPQKSYRPHQPRVAPTTVIKKNIKDILLHARSQFPHSNILCASDDYFQNEISWIKGKMIENKVEYIRKQRSIDNSTEILNAEDKTILWDLYSQYTVVMSKEGYHDFDDFALNCLKIMNKPGFKPPFTHLIIDEVQDLNDAQLEVLSKLVPTDCKAITIIADVAQQIYKSDFTTKKLGIDVRGRSVELRSNFRHTYEISAASNSLLHHEQSQEEFIDCAPPTRCGTKPDVVECVTYLEQLKIIMLKISQYGPNKSIAVICRNKKHLSEVGSGLERNGYSVNDISNGGRIDSNRDIITICTMHSVKGLEFDHVFICDINNMVIPAYSELQKKDYDQHISRERKLLFVAMTRAKTNLTMLTSGDPSPFLSEIDQNTVNYQTYAQLKQNIYVKKLSELRSQNPVRNLKRLVSTLRRYPENLVILSDHELCRLIADRDRLNLGINSIAEVVGEMLYRLWLYQVNTSIALKAELVDFLGKDTLTSFEREYSIFRKAPLAGCSGISPLWQNSSEQHRLIGSAALTKIRTCLNADGMVMVIKANRPVPIMFTLKPAAATSTLSVFDSKNKEVGVWSSSINDLQQYDIQGWSVKLHITATDDISFTGQSLDLPILMAILKKQGRLPLFSHLQVCATGAIDHGRLETVGYVDIKRRLATQLNADLFIYPNSGPVPESDGVLPCGIPIEDVHNPVNYMILDKGLGELSADAAANELEKLNNDVHFGVIAMEEKALNRLDMIEKELNRHRLNSELIKAQILRAAVYCHLGRTEEASKLNEDVYKQARESELYYQFAEAMIRQIVNQTDLGQFNDAKRTISKLQERLEKSDKFTQEEQTDLLMRFHGTVGQLYMYQALSDSDTTLEEEAFQHIDTAVKYAGTVDNQAEILIDLNYKHMWYILFDPANAQTAYIAAENAIMNAPDADKRSTNINYLQRQRLYAEYRHYLLTGEVNSFEEFHVSQNCKISWLKALATKYQATLTAGNGNVARAESMFAEAFVSLDQESNPLLFFLGMTIRVQAWQSLKGTEFDHFAQQCRDTAEQYFEQNNVLKTYVFVQKWLDFVKDDSKPNPQLQYQY